MLTIVKPRETISALWGKQQIKEHSDYRLMKYVIRVENDKQVLLHNAVTGQLVLLEKDEAEILNVLPSTYSPVMNSLVIDHYLVPVDFDEYRSVNQLRKIYQKRSTGDAINHYIILPTTFCNARCFYCYESDYPRVHMTAETADKIIDFIDEHRKGKKVLLSWFGGEPLVGMDRIDQISQGLQDRNIPFTSTMISNGYLFDEEVVGRSVDLWHLERVQITLDGTEDVYNRVKAYTSADSNPFQRVLRNIDLLSSKKIMVGIRLNVDFYNSDNIRELIEIIGKRYSDNKYVTAYLNMLFNDQGFEPVHHTQDEIITLVDIIHKYSKRLDDLHIRGDSKNIPMLQISQCMADNDHAIEIQPDGSFCRCEHENINDSYGNLDEGILDPQKLIQWKATIECSDQCHDCCLYPSCYKLQKCMNSDYPCDEGIRNRSLEQYRNLLLSVYQRSLEEKENESV